MRPVAIERRRSIIIKCCRSMHRQRRRQQLVTHAIRMATYNAESALARLLAVGRHFPMDEARALLREAFNTPGDLEVADGTLVVRLDPLSAPRRTRALAALCEELTATETTYPGTDLVLRYSVKDAPGVA